MCITEEKLVEAYGNSNPHERFLLIYKNYSVFPQLVDCYETGLFNRILFEVEYNRRKQYVTLDKRSKKAQREYYAKQRTTWGELNPVTRSVPSGKAYNRKKEKQRIGVEFRNGFDADFLRSLVLFIHFRTSESE